MKADSTATVEASDDPRLAELCFMVAFAIEDYEASRSQRTICTLTHTDTVVMMLSPLDHVQLRQPRRQ